MLLLYRNTFYLIPTRLDGQPIFEHRLSMRYICKAPRRWMSAIHIHSAVDLTSRHLNPTISKQSSSVMSPILATSVHYKSVIPTAFIILPNVYSIWRLNLEATKQPACLQASSRCLSESPAHPVKDHIPRAPVLIQE